MAMVNDLAPREYFVRAEHFGGLLFHKLTSQIFFMNSDGFELCQTFLAECQTAKDSLEKEARIQALAMSHGLTRAQLDGMWHNLCQVVTDRIDGLANLDPAMKGFGPVLELPPGERYLRSPLFLAWELSNRCNFDCNYCATDSSVRYKQNRQEFSFKEAFQVVQEIIELDIPHIFISGGEPFLVPYLGKLVRYLISANRVVVVATNGTLMHTQSLDDFRECVFQVKFDTIKEKRYEEITGIKGSFKSFVTGMRTLADSGRRYCLQAALTPQDTDDLEEMVKFAIEHKAWKIRFGPVMPMARGKSVDWQFSGIEAKKLLEQLGHLHQRYGEIVDWKESVISLGTYEQPHPEDHPITDCKATRSYMRLTYDRKVVPCNGTRYGCIGEYAPGHLKDIWNGDAIAALRTCGFPCPLRVIKDAVAEVNT